MRRLAIVAVLAACGGGHKAKPDGALPADGAPDGALDAAADAAIDAAVDAPPDADPLGTLFATGLCVDHACTQIAGGVVPYTPQFPLWADTASKRRWIYLPPGTQIDTTDMDHWVFPQGTKLWKEFTRDGVRVETRVVWKMGAGNTSSDWYFMAYQWNQTQDEALAVPSGVNNANGTQHDIPPVYQCHGCHDNLMPSRVLGFAAIQLDWANPTSGELDLDGLVAQSLLTANPAGAASPHFPLPSDASNASASAALGYLHANCGHCHNPTSSVYTNQGITMVLRLDVAHLASVGVTPAYTTAVGQHVSASPAPNGDTTIIVAGDPDHSVLIDRFESGNAAFHMPALGSEMEDTTADATLRDWITHIQ